MRNARAGSRPANSSANSANRVLRLQIPLPAGSVEPHPSRWNSAHFARREGTFRGLEGVLSVLAGKCHRVGRGRTPPRIFGAAASAIVDHNSPGGGRGFETPIPRRSGGLERRILVTGDQRFGMKFAPVRHGENTQKPAHSPVPVPPISTASRCSAGKEPLARSWIGASLTGVP
jgi:hypothetical protein